MPKDDFIDLLSLGAEEDERDTEDDDEGTLDTVIKNDELRFEDADAVVADDRVIESDAFTIKLFKKEDYIDAIEIECRCGRTARIQLEFEGTEDGGETERYSGTAEDEAPEEEEPAEFRDVSGGGEADADEDAEFREGIGAETVTAGPDQRIFEPPEEERDDTGERTEDEETDTPDDEA